MDAKIINIGRSYKEEFDAVVQLVSNNALDGSISYNPSSKAILDSNAGICFRYDESSLVAGYENDEPSFTSHGASWFLGLRGEKVEEDESMIWERFLNKVASLYHRKYSFIEYDLSKKADMPLTDALRDKMDRINKGLLSPEIANKLVREENPAASLDELLDYIYAINVKVKVEDEKPIVGTLYFRRLSHNRLQIMNYYAAKPISDFLNAENPKNEDVVLGSVDNDEKEMIFSSLKSFLTKAEDKQESAYNFNDYILYEESKSSSSGWGYIYNKCIVNGPISDTITLHVREVTVLGIMFIKWRNRVVDYSYLGRRVLRYRILCFGSEPTLSLRCLCCGCKDDLILEDKALAYGEDGEVTMLPLDLSRADLGLTPTERKNTLLAKDHLIRNAISPYCKDCDRLNCRKELLDVGKEGHPLLVCENCPYPYVVYHSYGKKAAFAKNLVLSENSLDLVEGRQGTCSCCARRFEDKELRNGRCEFCLSAERVATGNPDSAEAIEARKLYRRYHDLLPLHRRSNVSHKRKYAFENETTILFYVGKHSYVFDKKSIVDDGFIPSPKKVKN